MLNKSEKQKSFKKGDYIVYFYEKQPYNGTILEIAQNKAKIEICISCKKSEEPLFEELEVDFSKITKRF